MPTGSSSRSAPSPSLPSSPTHGSGARPVASRYRWRMNPPIIECRGLHKWYSGVHALKGVNLKVAEGESVGLVGDNGAGKSTLIKVLSGVHRPDQGDLLIDGKRVDIRNPKHAMQLGIETIYQYNSMVPTM